MDFIPEVEQKDNVTITFKSNGGLYPSDNSDSYVVIADFNGAISINSIVETPIRPSYILQGWSITEGGNVTYLPDASPTITADTMLYAVWGLRDDIGIVQLQLDTSNATAAAGDILSGKTAYVNGSKVIGNITSKDAATYTPNTANQTIAAGQYLSGIQTIKGDANLLAENIAEGVSIFGVTGTHAGGTAIETVNFSFVAHSNGESGSNFRFWYIDDSGQSISTTIPSSSASFTIPVMKGCIICTDGDNVDTGWSVSGPSFYERTYYGYGFAAVADSDITFTITKRAPSK